MYDVLRTERFPSMPVWLKRAVECVRTRLAGPQGQATTAQQTGVRQTSAPGRERELLRAVRRAARQYRQAQQALADREGIGGEEATFRALLDQITLSHGQLEAALLEIQRYYEATGVPDD